MIAILKSVMQMTAWPMTQPTPYSAFHILLTILGVGAAVICAIRCRRRMQNAAQPEKFFRHILFATGILLALMELYKQAFLYLIEFDGRFDWWYFPFQLCSIPMYLCLLVPLQRSEKGLRDTATFLQDFGLLGGIMALAVPPGLMHPYWTMTLHGFIWHFILLFLGIFSDLCGMAGRTIRDYLRILPLFFGCCIAAVMINVLAGPTGDADMFYLSPYHLSNQPIFHEISAAAGILPADLLYIAAMVLGGLLMHSICRVLARHSRSVFKKLH